MRLVVVDRSAGFCDAARRQFAAHPEVEVVCGRFEDLPAFDCVVTAGNSFGLMDAGMDLAVVRFFGRGVPERIQRAILDDHLGEQPVGTCVIVPTGHAAHPFVAHAPTMRVPMNIQNTDHVYLALWATLTAVHRHNRVEPHKIECLACPGLGTGTGGVEFREAALQMGLAYEHSVRTPRSLNSSVSQRRHERIHYGGRWGFDHPRPGTAES